MRQALIVMAVAFFVSDGRATAEGTSTWFTDYSAARAAARQSGKPIFLVFRCER